MKLLPERPFLSGALVVALGAILVLLAVLQYQWSGQVSEAEREQMRANLETSIRQFRWEFNVALLDACGALQLDRVGLRQGVLDSYAQRFDDWKESSPYPELIADLLIWNDSAEGEPQLWRLHPGTSRFEPIAWLRSLEGLRERLRNRLGPRGFFRGRRPRVVFWMMAGETPYLLQPLPVALTPEGAPAFARGRARGHLLVALDREFLARKLVDELVQRHFGGGNELVYRVGIFGGAGQRDLVYSSDAGLSPGAFESSDAKLPLLWERPEPGPPRRRDGLEPPPPPSADAPPSLDPRAGTLDWLQRLRGRGGPLLLLSMPEDNWLLAVRHREGSLDAAVDAHRRRNLLLGFGILLLLGASMAMVGLSARRAQRLARLQMDFVAGVSHEFRTPLAVIGSAADNLAEGVVQSEPQVKEYGALIRREGRRLSGMVEQTLRFAADQAGPPKYELRPVDIVDVVDQVVAEAQAQITEGGIEVERSIEAGLPLVLADRAGLAQALHNLMANAVKYGGAGGWVAIRVIAAGEERERQVQISVEDHGPGIDPADLPYIFDPFYRGRAANTEKVRGTGLGLSLAHSTIVGMGGSLTVSSVHGKGSRFTIRLPASASSAGAGLEPKERGESS